jgi:hypothetical protein
MESERAAAAAKEAEAHRALGSQILADAPGHDLERTAGRAHAMLSRRQSEPRSALFLVGVLSGLPHHAIGGPERSIGTAMRL